MTATTEKTTIDAGSEVDTRFAEAVSNFSTWFRTPATWIALVCLAALCVGVALESIDLASRVRMLAISHVRPDLPVLDVKGWSAIVVTEHAGEMLSLKPTTHCGAGGGRFIFCSTEVDDPPRHLKKKKAGLVVMPDGLLLLCTMNRGKKVSLFDKSCYEVIDSQSPDALRRWVTNGPVLGESMK